MAYQIGIDTGGTFTDIVVMNQETGALQTVKTASTPADPARAVLEGLRSLGLTPSQVTSITLGTTTTTNAVIQRKGARVIYITTAGFEDVPQLQRADRPQSYDFSWPKPTSLVRRRDSIGARERTRADGSVELEIDNAELSRVGDLVADKLDAAPEPNVANEDSECAVAINLLFSYANTGNEIKLATYLGQRFPDLSVSLSSEVSPLWREYERASTTILDAFTRPMFGRFLENIAEGLKADGFDVSLAVMKSNGGHMIARAAANRPIQFLLSGLAGGVTAGQAFSERMDYANAITFDMGGTSTDVAVVTEGRLTYTTEYQFEFGLPVSIPSLDVMTIGAGGGSIAWIDQGGLLKVGPMSAGAVPGPVCYGHGGTQPTVTDANLVLGRLGADSLLGGEMTIDHDAALSALGALGDKLGLDAFEAAHAVISVANENMANSIRVLTIERGLDPREFTLVAFGGSGPLHAVAIAEILEIPDVIVPPAPGVTSALGTLLTAPRVDRQQTYVRRADILDKAELLSAVKELESSARRELAAEGYKGPARSRHTVFMRYAGQSHEQEVPSPPDTQSESWIDDLGQAFHAHHERTYGYRIEDETIEITALAVSIEGDGNRLPDASQDATIPKVAPVGMRSVYTQGEGAQGVAVYERADFQPGLKISGPAIIDGYDSTTQVPAGKTAIVDMTGALLLSGKLAEQSARSADEPVMLSIINNALINTCREMGTAMIRTAYSPIFNESRDFSCALFDPSGQMLAQGDYCPAQLGAIVYTVECVLKEMDPSEFKNGDIIIHNDPYRGGCHLPEHLLLKPIFFNGKIVAYAAIIAHFAEIGGMVVGSFAATATEIFQEGLRIPPVRIMREGKRVQEVWDIMMANHRTPRHTWGDLHAIIGALAVAENRFTALCDKYGSGFVSEVSDALMDYAERWMRTEIEQIPDGVYEFEDHLEDDGVDAKHIRMHVKLTIKGSSLTADYSASDNQTKGPVNATRGVTMSATYNALYQLSDNGIPKNAGCYRPIEIISRSGSCLDVAYPAPSVGGNTETQPRIVFLVLGALSEVLPERVSASEGCTACNFLIGGENPRTGQYYAHYHFEASGWGGQNEMDGNDCQNHIIGNCRITPVEVFETRFPFKIISYGLRENSGGAGRHRGGLGSRRVLKAEAPEIRVSLMMDHAQHGPWSLFGGLPGDTASVTVRPNGSDVFVPFTEAFGTESASKFADVKLAAGDEVCIESCGGSGYGDPHDRSRDLVARDIEDGIVTLDMATSIYNWVD